MISFNVTNTSSIAESSKSQQGSNAWIQALNDGVSAGTSIKVASTANDQENNSQLKSEISLPFEAWIGIALGIIVVIILIITIAVINHQRKTKKVEITPPDEEAH